eukprot:89300-Chlamydomonas_euryale.AAC.4
MASTAAAATPASAVHPVSVTPRTPPARSRNSIDRPVESSTAASSSRPASNWDLMSGGCATSTTAAHCALSRAPPPRLPRLPPALDEESMTPARHPSTPPGDAARFGRFARHSASTSASHCDVTAPPRDHANSAMCSARPSSRWQPVSSSRPSRRPRRPRRGTAVPPHPCTPCEAVGQASSWPDGATTLTEAPRGKARRSLRRRRAARGSGTGAPRRAPRRGRRRAAPNGSGARGPAAVSAHPPPPPPAAAPPCGTRRSAGRGCRAGSRARGPRLRASQRVEAQDACGCVCGGALIEEWRVGVGGWDVAQAVVHLAPPPGK